MPGEKITIARWERDRCRPETDRLAVEEPLEIRVEYFFKAQRQVITLGLTLRTPGHDHDLARGLLFSEGWIERAADIVTIVEQEGAVLVSLREGVEPPGSTKRHQLRSSACGLCGREELPELPEERERPRVEVSIETLYALPEKLRLVQAAFQVSGALHAAALFTLAGEPLAIREDVGRHNALDKLVGHCLEAGRWPLAEYIVLLSGRAGYELLQKCAAANTTVVAALGAPSTMAVDLARRQEITLIGFLREGRCNVYTHSGRVLAASPDSAIVESS